MKRWDNKEHLLDFGDYQCDTAASIEEIQLAVKKYSKLGYDNLSVEIDYGYYEGEEHIALFGKKKKKEKKEK